MSTLTLGGSTLANKTGSVVSINDGVILPAGSVLQVVESKKTDTDSIATSSMSTWADVSGTDQAGAGSVFCCKITPSSSSHKVLVIATGTMGMSGSSTGAVKIKKTVSSTDSSPFLGDAVSGYNSVGSASAYGGSSDGNNSEQFAMVFVDSPNANNVEVTYTLQGSTQGTTSLRINALGADTSGQDYSLRSPSSIILIEIKA